MPENLALNLGALAPMARQRLSQGGGGGAATDDERSARAARQINGAGVATGDPPAEPAA